MKYLTNIDLTRNQVLNRILQQLGTAPGSPVKGLEYFDTTLNAPFVYDGTAWVCLDVSKALGTIPNAALVTPPVTGVNVTAPVKNSGTAQAPVIYMDAAAGPSTDGYMLGTDKAKLDAITGAVTGGNTGDNAVNTNYTNDYRAANFVAGTHYSAPGHTHTASNITDFDAAVVAHSLSDFEAPTADVSMAGFKVSDLAQPTASNDAATKIYVDDLITGLSWKDEVVAATTAPGTLATSFAAGQAIDGVTLAYPQRILIKNQAVASENGIYTVNTSGAPTRAPDANTTGELRLAAVAVVGGSQAGNRYTCNAFSSIGVSDVNFALFSSGAVLTAGNGLQLTTNEFSVKLPASSGLVVDGTGTYINTAIVARKYSVTIPGDDIILSHIITHNLGTQDVQVAIREVGGSFNQVFTDVACTSTNTITLSFAIAPAANQYRVTVIG